MIPTSWSGRCTSAWCRVIKDSRVDGLIGEWWISIGVVMVNHKDANAKSKDMILSGVVE